MGKRKTHEEFVAEVNKLNPHIEISGLYVNAESKINCKCNVCGYEWTTTAKNLLKPKKCLGCIQKIRIFKYPDISHKDFCNIVANNYPTLSVTGIYKTGMKTISCTCNDCGHHARVRVQMLLENTYKCPICNNGKETIKYGINDIKTVNPVLYECLKDKSDNDKYTINSRAKTDFICPCCHQVIKNKTITTVNRRGLKCKCQDGNSLGEKYFYQVMKSIDENIETEK